MNLIYFFMGIGLSMDAFSIAISIGTTNPNKKIIIIQSLLVGIFHLFMPILGSLIPINTLISRTNILTSIIFLILSIEMYRSRNKEEEIIIKNIITIILISFTVSIDSFIVGTILKINNANMIITSCIFSFTSFIFTFLGLNLGIKLKEKYKEKANVFGSIILFLISIKYFVG